MATKPPQASPSRITLPGVGIDKLRQELEARQRQLTALSRRKQELQGQLSRVEAEIAAVASGAAMSKSKATPPAKAPAKPAAPAAKAPAKPAAPAAKAPAKPAAKAPAKPAPAAKPKPPSPSKPAPGAAASVAKPAAAGKEGLSLTMLIEDIVGKAKEPVTVKGIREEALRRGFKSSSQNFSKLVETRAYDMQRKGILGRIAGKPGFILKKASGGHPAASQAAKTGGGSAASGKPKPKSK
jgi:hypothetical protein